MRRGGGGLGYLYFLFGARGSDEAEMVGVYHGAGPPTPMGHRVDGGGTIQAVSGTANSANMPSLGSTDVLWVRVASDGSTLSVYCLKGASAPSEAAWSGTGACYSSTSFDLEGGMLGLSAQALGNVAVDDLTVKADRDANGSYETTEHAEGFTLDASGYADETLTHDRAGTQPRDTLDGERRQTVCRLGASYPWRTAPEMDALGSRKLFPRFPYLP